MTVDGPDTRDSGGHRSEERAFLLLGLYRAALLLLATVVLSFARSKDSGLDLVRALPFLDSTLGLWCLFQLSILLGFAIRRRSVLSQKLAVTTDFIFSLALVWWTGGVESFFLPILYANVLAASTFVGLPKAQLLASAATLTLIVMTVGRIKGWSPAEWTGISPFGIQGRLPFISLCLIGEGIAFHVIAFLGARLMGGLRRAERTNQLIVENIDEGILVMDAKKRLLLMNAEAFRLLGYPQNDDYRGRLPADLLRRADDTPIREILENPVAGERRVQCRIGREDVVPMSIRLLWVQGEATTQNLWVTVFRDLTLERRAALAESRIRRLQEIEDLALGLVHEIRNPLASIRGCVQELGRGRLDPGQAERFSRIVVRESDRLDRIVNDFLEYSRTGPTHAEPVDLGQCLHEVVESLVGRNDAKGVHISAAVEGDARQWVGGQKELIYRVFLNLGINALEASEGSGRIQFRCRQGRLGGWEIIVEDNGSGMDEATVTRIFNPFFTTKPREGGLGLALVERILHGHGGSIDVESVRGIGTCFRVWLPGLDSSKTSPYSDRAAIGAAS